MDLTDQFKQSSPSPNPQPPKEVNKPNLGPGLSPAPSAPQSNLQTYTRPLPPEKKGFFLRIGKGIKDIFGQFLTLQFYKDAAKTVVHEMMVAFMYGFGKGVVHIATKKANPETAGMKMTNSQNSPNSAFSSGFGSTSNGLRSGFSSTPKDNIPFPGF